MCENFGPLSSFAIDESACSVLVSFEEIMDGIKCVVDLDQRTISGNEVSCVFQGISLKFLSCLIVQNYCSEEEVGRIRGDEEEWGEMLDDMRDMFSLSGVVTRELVGVRVVDGVDGFGDVGETFDAYFPLPVLPLAHISFPCFLVSYPLSAILQVEEGVEMVVDLLQSKKEEWNRRVVGGELLSVQPLVSLSSSRLVSINYSHPHLSLLPSDGLRQDLGNLISILADEQRSARAANRGEGKGEKKGKKRIEKYYVTGFREVLRGVRARNIQLIVLASESIELEPIHEMEEEDEKKKGEEEEGVFIQKVRSNVDEIVDLASENEIPVIGGLKMGFIQRAIKVRKRLKIVGIYEFQGAFPEKKRIFRSLGL